MMAQLPVRHEKGVIIVLYRRRDSAIEYALFDRILNWKGVELSKGGIGAGESAEQAAAREVKEEAGITVERVVHTESAVRFGFTSHDKKGKKVRIERDFAVFTADITGHEPKPDCKEHSRVWFAPFDEAVKALTYSDMKNLLKDVHRLLSGTGGKQ